MATFEKTVINIKQNNRTIYAIKYLPINSKKCPAIILSHGFNGAADNFEKHCGFFASHSIVAVCYDFCGGSLNTKSDLKTTDMTVFTEKEDLVAVLNEVKTWDSVDRENIFLFGASQGGFVSALAAEDYKDDVRGLVLQFPALCIPDDWNKKYPTVESIPETISRWNVPIGRKYAESLHGFDTFAHIGKYNGAVQIFHGDNDKTVPLEYSKKAIKVYKNAKLEVFRGEGHGFSDIYETKTIEMTYDFIKENLKA